MTTLLDRYRNGERERVWAELLAYGSAVRTELLLPVALDVARETMTRVRANIEQLVPRLEAIGYFIGGEYAPSQAWTPPEPDTAEQIARLERLVGPIPLSLRAWYEIVGSVSFIGFHPGWTWDSSEVLPDPLVIYPITQALADCEERLNDMDWDKAWQNYVPIAPDQYHKENFSGGPVYAIGVPNAAADAQVLDEWHDTTFVNYLRICFRWGGFPGFERYEKRPKDHLTFLAEGLLPI